MAQGEGLSEQKGSLGPEKCHHPGHHWLLGQSRILTAISGRLADQEVEKEQEQKEGCGRGHSQARGAKRTGGQGNSG